MLPSLPLRGLGISLFIGLFTWLPLALTGATLFVRLPFLRFAFARRSPLATLPFGIVFLVLRLTPPLTFARFLLLVRLPLAALALWIVLRFFLVGLPLASTLIRFAFAGLVTLPGLAVLIFTTRLAKRVGLILLRLTTTALATLALLVQRIFHLAFNLFS